ncbi:uncharacterized protein PgNI_09072 [Pyricularia grisea]|uniref:Uncharacterized protein n=1 Tax=Pyricularia grisea TaxID=148305 RepID=A0A6P8ATK8_PYRGI|nr:uncharacterized protein PgNI_09072 [Pyricularia grisea]TLD05450.1 hypothetical protein PgNI_09072 [Pyricularia grisea]
MHLTPSSLRARVRFTSKLRRLLLLVAWPVEEVVKHRAVDWTRTQAVEADGLPGVDYSQLPGHGGDGAFAGGVSQLGYGAADRSGDGAEVDHAAARLGVAAHGQHRVSAAQPGAEDVDEAARVEVMASPSADVGNTPALLTTTSGPPRGSSWLNRSAIDPSSDTLQAWKMKVLSGKAPLRASAQRSASRAHCDTSERRRVEAPLLANRIAV